MSGVGATPIVVVSTVVLALHASSQSNLTTTAIDAGRSFGFTQAELQRIRDGVVITKDSKEGSEKELAGVVAIFFETRLTVLADLLLEGEMVKTDPDVRMFDRWKPGQANDGMFTGLELEASESNEANFFLQAAPSDRLNLAAVEIQSFRLVHSRQAVNEELGKMLRNRYEAYRAKGLKGVLPYAHQEQSIASVGKELAMAITETTSLARVPGYSQALLNYPADSLSDMQHRFFAYKQEVDDRPAFILSHRAGILRQQEALITEQRYYVSHTYDCRFIASHCFEVPGGVLLFYCNRTFTDKVGGFGSGLKHSIGRKRMLSDVASSLKTFRERVHH